MKSIPLTHCLYIAGLDERFRYFMFRELADNGGENLVLSDMILELVYNAENPLKALKNIKKEVNNAGLKFVDAHSIFGPHIDLNCPFPADREKSLAIHKMCLACCNECEVDTITIHIGNPRFPGLTLEEYREFIRRSLTELLPAAERYGVTICIENIWSPVNTVEELTGHCEYFNSPYLGMCFDAGHANLRSRKSDDPQHPVCVEFNSMGLAPEWDDKILEKMLPYIVNCHLHDNDGTRDAHWTPFNGNNNWDKTMTLLAKAPKLRSLQNEVILPGRDLNSSIHHMCKTFEKLLAIFNSGRI